MKREQERERYIDEETKRARETDGSIDGKSEREREEKEEEVEERQINR